MAHPAALAAVELAIEHRRAGRFDEALAAYRQAMTHDARAYEVQYSFANFCAERGRFAEAIAAYQAALAANPHATDALNNLGAVQLMAGERAQAKEIKAEIRRAFYPDADDWRRMVWSRAEEVTRRALGGVAAA